MPIAINCPACATRLKIPDHLAGRSLACPKCQAPLAVPVSALVPTSGSNVHTPRTLPPKLPATVPGTLGHPHTPAHASDSASKYFVRDGTGHISGPFSTEELRRRAADNQLLASWFVSTDRVVWHVAAQVHKLFDVVESALFRQLPPGKRLRDLSRTEQLGLLVDRFVLRDGDFLARFGWLKPMRRLIARWTLPRTIVLAQLSGGETRYVQFDPAAGTEKVIDQPQADRVRSEKVGKSSLFPFLLLGLILLWAVWVVKDFSVSWTALKTLALSAIALVGKVRDVRRTKVLVGYDMDAATRSRLLAIRQAFGSLSTSSGVWFCQREAHRTVKEWKEDAGNEFKVSRMPAVQFSRGIPNVDTNVRIMGLAYENKAIYFFPENIMVKEGNSVRYIDYKAIVMQVEPYELNDTERRTYPDAQLLRYTYRFPNRQGGADRRYSEENNPQDVPVYRFGLLRLSLGATSVELLLTNAIAGKAFQERFYARPAVAPSSSPSSAADEGVMASTPDNEDAGEERQSFKEWVNDVIIPALGVARAIPSPVWIGSFLLVFVILIVGGLYSTLHAADLALTKADELYDAGKRSEAVAVYRQYPNRLVRSDGGDTRHLRRLIEYDLAQGDVAEARGWIEKSLDANVTLEFNEPKATELYRQMKTGRERLVAEARAEEEARQKAAAAETERRQREDKQRAEEERRQREEREEKRRAEAEVRAKVEHERRLAGYIRDLSNPDAGSRLAAVKALEQLGDRATDASPDVVARLSQALKDSDQAVRQQAFEAVTRIAGNNKAAVPGLIDALNAGDVSVRMHAASLLKVVGVNAAEATTALANSLSDPKVRPEASEALARIGKPAVLPLIKVLDGLDRSACLEAIQTLGRIGSEAKEAGPSLIALLHDQEIRLEVVKTLGKIGKPVVPDLIKALNESNASIRQGAAMTLGHIGAEAREAIPKLSTLARTDLSMDVRDTARLALTRISR